MSTTLVNLRAGLSQRLNDYWVSTCSSNGTAAKKDIVDTALADKRSEPSEGQYILYTDATNNTGEIRRVQEYDSDNTTIIVTRAFTSATVSTDNYELHTFHPDDIERALNYARTAAYPWVRQLIDEEIIMGREGQRRFTLPTTMVGSPHRVYLGSPASAGISDNLLDNGDFEEWVDANTPTGWTLTDLTVTRTSIDELKMRGSYSAQCIGTGSTPQIAQWILGDALQYAGSTLTASVWIYCSTAALVRLVLCKGITDSDDVWHQGKGWEQLSASGATDGTTAGVKISSATASGVFYVDDAILWSGQKKPATSYSALLGWDVNGGVIEFPYSIPEAYPVRVIGTGYPSIVGAVTDTLSADADTLAVDDPQTELIYAEAAYYLYRQLFSASPGQKQESLAEAMDYWDREIRRLRKEVGMASPAMLRIAPSWGR